MKERPSDFSAEELLHIELLDALTRAARAKRTTENTLHRTILKAHLAGLSFRAIGKAVGLSHTRIIQIVRAREAEHGLPKS